jgi:hypothetical protein
MVRGNPAYDPNRIGAISEQKIIAALVAAGKVVYVPVAQGGCCDALIVEPDRVLRVQCKTGRLIRGAIVFRPHRLRAARRETGWVREVRDYYGDIDLFGVYCPEYDRVYLVPIEDIAGKLVCSLRVEAARNNQAKKITWARDYELTPLRLPPLEQDRFGFDD